MANLQQYTKAVIYINDSVLSEEASVTVKRSSGSQPVKTVAKGYSGESPGSPMTEISVSNAVPASDFELDPGLFINLVDVVKITIFAAGRTMTVKGSIIDDNFSHAVDSEAKLEFNFRGGVAYWE